MNEYMLNELRLKVERLISLCESVKNNMTESAIANEEPGDFVLNGFDAFTKSMKADYQNLCKVIESANSTDKELCSSLFGFSQKSRWFSEVGCYWSTNFNAIETTLGDVDKIQRELVKSL